MALNSIDNDAEIALALAEEYALESSLIHSNPSTQSRLCWSNSSETFRIDDTQQIQDNNWSTQEHPTCSQMDEDSEIAYILQVEEIILSENKIYGKAAEFSDARLEKTHADMTKALQTTKSTDLMNRIFGMFATIQTRYVHCQTKNQTLIEQMQALAIQLLPLLTSVQKPGATGISRTAAPAIAVGLITNVLQGGLEFNDAKQIMFNLGQMWNESSVWYGFLEQLVYILVAVTVPTFSQGAMSKIINKISS